jgi:hypothetical protein
LISCTTGGFSKRAQLREVSVVTSFRLVSIQPSDRFYLTTLSVAQVVVAYFGVLPHICISGPMRTTKTLLGQSVSCIKILTGDIQDMNQMRHRLWQAAHFQMSSSSFTSDVEHKLKVESPQGFTCCLFSTFRERVFFFSVSISFCDNNYRYCVCRCWRRGVTRG